MAVYWIKEFNISRLGSLIQGGGGALASALETITALATSTFPAYKIMYLMIPINLPPNLHVSS